MPRTAKSLLANVSAAELKRMLSAKTKIEQLEAEKAKLESALAKIDKEIAQLLGGAVAGKPRKKATRKKVAKKKVAAKKKTTTGKVTTKKAGKKTTRKKVTRKAPAKRAASATKVTLEDVVVKVIKDAGKQASFQGIKAAIEKGRLYKSKSKNFDNVLRRTISTSKKLKRVARGVYAVK